jgi:hypothetical protein
MILTGGDHEAHAKIPSNDRPEESDERNNN